MPPEFFFASFNPTHEIFSKSVTLKLPNLSVLRLMETKKESKEKIRLSGGQAVSAEYIDRLSRLVLSFIDGLRQIVPDDQTLYGKLQDLQGVIEKTVEAQDPSGLQKEVLEYFDNKKLEEDFRILEKEGLVDVVRELSHSIQEIVKPTGAFDDELGEFIAEIESTDSLLDIRALKDKIIEKTRSVQKGFKSIREELDKSKQLSESLQKKLKESEARVIIDGLTRVLNRTAYDLKIEQMVSHFNRYKDPATLAVIDIDNFKGVNDQFGHQAGDNTLKSIAFLIRDSIRESDVVFRYGGEEFTVIFNKTDIKGAQLVAEKVRSRIENVRTHLVNDVYADRDKRLKITVSMGLAEIKQGDTAESLFKRADGALLRAKAGGKNVIKLS